jgi:hypothetical protein
MPRCRTLCRSVLPTAAVLVASGAFAASAGALTPNPAHIEHTPVLGWSSWSAMRFGADTKLDETEARAMVSSGLKAEGYRYINQDDGWYACPKVSYTGAHPNYGPTVDRWGRWVVSQKNTANTGAFPSKNGVNGIKRLAAYVHSRGLKFGIYLTPGISGNALAQDTPVQANAHGHLLGHATRYTADEITIGYHKGLKPARYPKQLTDAENYNCGGTWELNYHSPGAQAFVDGEADEFASWGVDYVKLDGILDHNTTDLKAWAKALKQSGRKIVLDTTEGAYDTKIVPQLNHFANQWEYTPDVEDYNSKTSLTDYPSIYPRFNSAALWEHFGGPTKGYNDLDSVEVGNGQTPARVPSAAGDHGSDGLTLPGRETVLSLWSLASSPIILGTDLRQLTASRNPVDLALLRNRQVLAIDQDGISAQRVSGTADAQVFSKREPNGTVIVGLFNTNYTQPEVVSTTAAAVGLPAGSAYTVRDLWGDESDLCAAQPVLSAITTPKSVTTPLCAAGTPATSTSGATIAADVPAEGVALYAITPQAQGAATAAPSTALALSGAARLVAGKPQTVTAAYTNNGTAPAGAVNLGLSTPAGWTVTPTSCPIAGAIAPGQTVSATFTVTAPAAQTGAVVTATTTPAPATGPQCGVVAASTGAPAAGTSATSETATVVASPVVINELQTGSTSKPNAQFVELYNPSASPVDVSGWKLSYQAQLAPNGYAGPATLATLPQGAVIAAGGYYLIGGAGYTASAGEPAANATFASKSGNAISQIGGSLGLLDAQGDQQDAIGWGVADNEGFAPSSFQRASGAYVEDCPAQANGVVPTPNTPTLSSLISSRPTPPSIPAGDSLQRLPGGQDTGSNCADFALSTTPTPGAANGS